VLEQFPGLKLSVIGEQALAGAIAERSSDVAVVPRDGSWIESFAAGAFGRARLIGCLPLISVRDMPPDLLIFGHADVEPTGADRTVAVLRGKTASGLYPVWSQQRGDFAALCLEGIVDQQAPVLDGLPIHIAGHYPVPLQPRK
jgi:hypothetical protein